MRAALYSCILLALATALFLWRIGTPVDSSQCADTPPGPLTGFIRQHFSDRQGADWRDDGSALGILGVAEAQAFARQPERYYCEALNLLQDPQRTQTEKVHTTALMLSLPLDYYLDLMDRSHQLYQRGAMDRAVLTLVLIPRGTALNYWWLPQWRSRFQRDAPGILAETDIKEILSGEHWFDYPGRGY
ncbi:hypothetical protein [Pseudomonas protegens]|uniref:hypothetical protein n=1 Tax=Pseudomonas protegens TaxID=380021 RepID=UPI001B32D836|nr:hypothetical protein [Pseudomonas protegens]MBP5106827.1 hypothetical protein [Pseudomonas protegens]MBP5121073.1 hypothetical protein [Pseudomonas protegens]MBP5130607.1 hypothetical protein [Pseudomonas protegens]MBP5147217.1 hypothetical protein [Pseudomonas protegens]MDK1398681.1 hypothetical protein [Pseudomonas protegens]